MIDRRNLICTTAAVMLGSHPLARAAYAADNAETLFVSACRQDQETFALVVFSSTGRVLRQIPLVARGHDIAIHPQSGRAVIFARRPGTFAVAFNVTDDREPNTVFQTPEDRHFYGHGVFSSDGHLLYATENDFDDARGVIGIYDATSEYQRVGEFPSHGIGPHEVQLLADGRTLVVANGGIETHPLSGRRKLNIFSMQPSLCFIDRTTGDLKVRHDLPEAARKLSIRHLAVDQNGSVWFGGQWQDDTLTSPDLIGNASRDRAITFLQDERFQGAKLRGYIGSVALSRDGRWLAATAPRAGHTIFVDTQQKRIAATQDIVDGCGVAASPSSGFGISSGEGMLVQSKPSPQPDVTRRYPGVSFDNHLKCIS